MSESEPVRRSRKGLWIALPLAAVLLAAGVAIVVKFVLPVVAEGNAVISSPDTVAGLTRTTKPSLQSTAEQLNTQLRAGMDNVTGSVATFYDDPTDPAKIVMLYGVTGPITNPARTLEASIDQLTRGGGISVEGMDPVDPGPLGGEASCGAGSSSGGPLTVCGWADHGSTAVVIFFNRDLASSTALFGQIHNAVLTRG
jgi:hypothetical protein